MPEVCHNYMAGRCRRTADECRYRHPEACQQHKKGRCGKKAGTCRFAHIGKPQFDRPPRAQQYVDPKPQQSRADRLQAEIDEKMKQLEKIKQKEEERQARINREKLRKEGLTDAKEVLGVALETFKEDGGYVEDMIEPLEQIYTEKAIATAFKKYLDKPLGPGLGLLRTRRHAQQPPAGRSGCPPPARTGNHTPTYSQRRPPPSYRADGPTAHEQTASLDAPPKHWMRSTREWNKLMHATNGNIITTAPRRPGDWNCGRCSAHNFSRRQTCIGGGAPRPPPAAAPARPALPAAAPAQQVYFAAAPPAPWVVGQPGTPAPGPAPGVPPLRALPVTAVTGTPPQLPPAGITAAAAAQKGGPPHAHAQPGRAAAKEICRAHRAGKCRKSADKCRFAHPELRPVPGNAKERLTREEFSPRFGKAASKSKWRQAGPPPPPAPAGAGKPNGPAAAGATGDAKKAEKKIKKKSNEEEAVVKAKEEETKKKKEVDELRRK
eukprot:gene9861-7266_t